MSMYEALRKLRGVVPWLSERDEEPAPLPPPTPLEQAEGLVLLAKEHGLIEHESPTWKAVARWAAHELILTQAGLETATGDKATELRGAAKKLRQLLAIDERQESNMVIEDRGPYVP